MKKNIQTLKSFSLQELETLKGGVGKPVCDNPVHKIHYYKSGISQGYTECDNMCYPDMGGDSGC